MAQLKNPPAPVSKTVQRLLAQIHAEAEAATLAALSAKDGIVTLQDIDRDNTTIRSYCVDGLAWEDRNGYSLRMSRERFCASGDGWTQTDWKPHRWYLFETRIDGAGYAWTRFMGYFVIDDFGTLVPVGGAA